VSIDQKLKKFENPIKSLWENPEIFFFFKFFLFFRKIETSFIGPTDKEKNSPQREISRARGKYPSRVIPKQNFTEIQKNSKKS
jgi:hypothetical protein